MTRIAQKQKTRTDILDVAAGLFTIQGIAATATADIAKACGLSHGAVFVHFKTRDDLVLAVIDSFAVAMAGAFEAAVENEVSLEGVLGAHVRTLARYEDFHFRLLTELYALPASVRGTLFAVNAAVSQRVFDAASPLMEKGALKKMTRPVLFNTWMALVTYNITNRDLLSSRTPILEAKGRELVNYFISLVSQ